MLRTPATRLLLRNTRISSVYMSSYSTIIPRIHPAPPLQTLRNKRPELKHSTPSSLLWISTKDQPINKIDREAERKRAEEKLKPTPESISTASSVRHVFEESQTKPPEDDDMTRELKADFNTIKETFSLSEVPKESLYLGLAGVLPYVATSLSTVFLTYNINNEYSIGALFAPETARYLLDVMVPMQIGYGAVIISFLGAIHWGLEYAGYGGHKGYYRFFHGVIPTAIAWPTLLMPVESALITQFLTFSALYFSDARATVKGWCPPWYTTYRFVLTLLVGASIVISLIGRGQIMKHDGTFKDPVAKLQSDRDTQRKALDAEQAELRKKSIKESTKGEEKPESSGSGKTNEEKKSNGNEDNKTNSNNKKSENDTSEGSEGKKKAEGDN
ncbi:hypothetical protein B7463_g1902, partial [Scytalidium lignicola]